MSSTLYYQHQTARGVFKDIHYSPLKSTVGDMTFFFTSVYNLSRFEDKYEQELVEFKQKVESIYWGNHKLYFDELALIRLYMRIEKRGFLLSYKGEQIDCPENIAFKTELKII